MLTNIYVLSVRILYEHIIPIWTLIVHIFYGRVTLMQL